MVKPADADTQQTRVPPTVSRREEHRFAREWGLLAVAVLVLGGLLALYLHALHASVESQEQERLATQAKVVDENLASQLEAASRALDSIRNDLPFLTGQVDGRTLLNRRLHAISEVLPGVRTVLVLDAQGVATASNREVFIGQNYSHQEFFQRPRQSRDPLTLHVAVPLPSTLGSIALPLAKAVTNSRGEPAGVVAAFLEPEYFTTLLNSVRYAPGMWTALIHSGGTPYLVVPTPPNGDGLDLSDQARITVQRSIQPATLHMDKPLLLTVARERDAVFAAWRTDAWMRAGVFAALVCVAALSVQAHQRRQRALRHSESARQRSEAQLRMLYETDLVGLAITSPEKGWIRINHCLCDMLEFSEEELRTMTWAQLTHPDDLAADVTQFDKLLAGAIDGYRLEKRFISRTGKRIPTNLVVRAVRKDSGELDFVTAMVEDITEQKQAEAAMRESQARYRTLIEWTPIAIVVHRVGTILYANPAALRLFGVPAGHDLTGRKTWELIHPDFRDEQATRMQSIMAQQTIRPMVESRFLKLDGTVIDVEVQGTSITYEGEPAIHVSVRDISERKRDEAQLRLAASVFSHTREGITITDSEGTILDVNEGFTRITGYPRDEVLGRNPRLLQSGRQDRAFYTSMWSQLIADGYWSGELWNRRRNGEFYAEILAITAVRNAQGVTQQYLGVFWDITERKQLEDQVRQLAFYDPLTHLPNRRLLNDRLKQTLAASKRSGHCGALMFLDLDNFKPLNDAHGHSVGDLLLIAVGQRLATCVRETDTVARFGGDEFVVMLAELNADRAESTTQARIVAEKIRAVLSEPYQLTIQKRGADDKVIDYHCSASIGVIVFVDHEASQEDLLKWADLAMYQSKEAGRNAIRFYGEHTS